MHQNQFAEDKKLNSSKIDRWTKIIGLIAAIIGIPIAILTLSDMLSKRTGDKSGYQTTGLDSSRNESELSDIFISQLSGPGRLKPLDGHQVLQVENNRTIYTGGFRAFFTFSHNTKGSHAITVTGIQLNLHKFDPRQKPEYDYKIDSESIIGAGKTKPDVFLLSLDGNKVGRATKVLKDKSFISRSENIFDTESPEKIAFKPQNDFQEEVQITVSAWKNGLYEVSFTVDYHVAGEDRRHKTESIFLYYWED